MPETATENSELHNEHRALFVLVRNERQAIRSLLARLVALGEKFPETATDIAKLFREFGEELNRVNY